MSDPGSRGFASDLTWNYASIAVLAASGLAFNFIVAASYDTAALGVFNLAYAVYLLLSQLASAGIHMSVLRAGSKGDDTAAARHLASGLWAALATSTAVAVASLGVLLAARVIWPSARTDALLTLPAALVFFALNKVALNYLNARGRMRAYAILQALRFVLIGLALAALAAARVPGTALPYCFALTEASLCVATLAVFAVRGELRPAAPTGGLIKQHISFGWKIMPANLILEFNTKIDLVVLSLLTGDDVLVGHYSFASLFVEGLYQLFVVIRRQINPALARMEQDGVMDKPAFASLRSKLIRHAAPAGVIAAAALVGVYQLVPWLLNAPGYRSATWPLALMLLAVGVTAVPVILGNVLNQTGHPLDESKVNVAAAAANLLVGLALAKPLGMWGAAIAVAASYIVFGVALRVIAARRLDVRI
jgi:O-antigen/teichoic acid export membrane protein